MLTTKDVAEMFNVSPRTVIRWIVRGQLEAYKTGKDYRIEPTAIESFKQSIKTGGFDHE